MEVKQHQHIVYKVDNTDLDSYYNDSIDESDMDNDWLLSAALLLGISVSTLASQGGLTDEVYSNIMSITVTDLPGIPATDLSYYQSLQQELIQHGRLEDPRTMENLASKWAERQTDQMGMFGDLEAFKSGALDAYAAAQECGVDIMIPWNPTGDNTCDDCLAEVDNGPFKPEDFPEPVHFGDQCNDPMADPIIVFGDGLGTNIVGEIL